MIKKFIVIILLILSLGGMYYFSSQNGEISTKQSNSVIDIVDEIRQEVTLKDDKLINIKEKIFNKLKIYGNKSYVVRKIAHFSIYACIGIAITLFIYLFSNKIFLSAILAFILSIAYALFDEYRQLSVDGRAGSLKDVFIDSMGALTGIACIFIILVMCRIISKSFKKSIE